MPLLFRPNEPLPAGLSRLVKELVEHALTLITHPTEAPEENIREIRTTIKRLRALLLLLRPALGDRSYRREAERLQNAARRLASARDLAVARNTVVALAKRAAAKRDRAAFGEILQGFRRVANPETQRDRGKALGHLAAALRKSMKSIPRLCPEVQEWHLIGPGLEEVYGAGRKRMKTAFARNDDASFHRWRTRVKNLYHLLQMFLPVWPARLRKTVARLKRLHRKLGDDHDLAVLISVLRDAPTRFGRAGSVERVITCLQARSRKLRKASGKLGEGLYRQRPGRFSERFDKRWRKWRGVKRSRSFVRISGGG